MDQDPKPEDKQKRLDEERRQQQTATELIRGKLSTLYAAEPNAKEELDEVYSHIGKDPQLSKHQQYMKDLSSSGRSLAEIQAAWHEYYAALPDAEKHQVWQEFYDEHSRAKQTPKAIVAPTEVKSTTIEEPAASRSKIVTSISHNTAKLKKKRGRPLALQADLSTANDVREHLMRQVQQRANIRKNPHVRALGFGLTMGALTLFVLLFGFFNERFITPFIRPSTSVSATPIIIDPNASGPIGPEAKIIIPKINVEAPVVYDVPTIAEDDVQKGLESGVVHYITTPSPGEKGNSVIFGHSSSNILNKGKYKFAFILLKSLEKEDTFIIQKDSKRYVYKVYNKFIVSPQDVSVLGPTDRVATLTLVTCDPPGTSTNRLIIQAEQIFPDPSTNAKSSVQPADTPETRPQELPSNSVSMWQRVKNWF